MVAQELNTDLSSGSNPSTAIHTLLTDSLLLKVPHWAGESLYTFIPQAPQLAQLSVGLIAPFIPVAGAAGMAGLAGLAGVAQPAPTLPGAVAAPAPSHTGAPVAMAPGLNTPAPTPATAPAPAPAPAAAAAAPVAAPAPPAPGVPAFGYPYVVGPPGLGAGTSMSVGSRAGQNRPSSTPSWHRPTRSHGNRLGAAGTPGWV